MPVPVPVTVNAISNNPFPSIWSFFLSFPLIITPSIHKQQTNTYNLLLRKRFVVLLTYLPLFTSLTFIPQQNQLQQLDLLDQTHSKPPTSCRNHSPRSIQPSKVFQALLPPRMLRRGDKAQQLHLVSGTSMTWVSYDIFIPHGSFRYRICCREGFIRHLTDLLLQRLKARSSSLLLRLKRQDGK